MYLFITSKKDPALSKAEIEALYPKQVKESSEAVFLIQSRNEDYKKLAYTKEVHEILFSTPTKKLFSKIEQWNWQKTIGTTSYAIRSKENEKKIADTIWNTLKKPKVSLKNPNKEIHFFSIKKTVYATLLLWKNPNTFLQRKPHLREEQYPASLDPQLAAAMINLGGSTKGTIVDPFCGTGGILIEGVLSGRKMIGFDKSKWMLEKCKKNLEQYNLFVPLKQQDATTFQKKCAAIVTELPFGKNTQSQDLVKLYTLFLQNAKKSTKTIVVSFPDFIDYKKIVKKTGWKIKYDFAWYLHKSLTKHVVVLDHK